MDTTALTLEKWPHPLLSPQAVAPALVQSDYLLGMDTSSCRLEDFSLPLNAETIETVLYFYLSIIYYSVRVGHFLMATIGPPSLTDNEMDFIGQWVRS